MKIRLYFDEDSMRRSPLRALRARGVDVIGMHEHSYEMNIDSHTCRQLQPSSLSCPVVAYAKSDSRIRLYRHSL